MLNFSLLSHVLLCLSVSLYLQLLEDFLVSNHSGFPSFCPTFTMYCPYPSQVKLQCCVCVCARVYVYRTYVQPEVMLQLYKEAVRSSLVKQK